MPRYFFDLDDGRPIADAECLDLPDPGAARREAARRAAGFALGLAERGEDGAVVIRVREASGAGVLSVMLVSLVEADRGTGSVAVDGRGGASPPAGQA